METFVDDIIALLQANLPTKITDINTEKGNFPIVNIENANYYDNIGHQVLNINQFIYYTIVDIVTNTNGHQTSLEVTLAVSVVFDNTNGDGTIQKVLRYSRALREVLQDNFKDSSSTSRFRITEFVPIDIQLNEGSDFKMGGIHVTSTITG